MILIIAEKPSLARNIVSAIGTMKRNDGYYSNQDYLVTSSRLHKVLIILNCFCTPASTCLVLSLLKSNLKVFGKHGKLSIFHFKLVDGFSSYSSISTKENK